jgi:ABC-type glycerol-3-phosphate transport system substrate-binding protein
MQSAPFNQGDVQHEIQFHRRCPCEPPLPMPAQAQTEIQWWHSMTAVNGEWVNDLAKDFNASQTKYKIVPVQGATTSR